VNSTAPWRTVVGVAGRVKQYELGQDGRIAVYLPHGQATTRALYVAVRSELDPARVMPAIRNELRAMDPNLPIYRMRPMSTLVDASLAQHRFAMRGLIIFALVALLLAAIGTYAVLAYVVTQGRREMGIRLALGATPGHVQSLVLRQGLIVAGIGAVLGLGASLVLARAIGHLVFGVGTSDPITYLAVAGVLALVVIAASFFPARRASRVDPVIALRAE
jgi:predicted lysophospholipase L1 biosynthesis ABC-type transport system permease subunit